MSEATVRAVCPRHPDQEALGTCARCGRFVCAMCAPDAPGHPDAQCSDCKAARGARFGPDARRVLREIALLQAVLGLFLATMMVIVSVRMGSELPGSDLAMTALRAGIVSLPFLVSAGLVAFAKRLWSAWLAFALDAALAGWAVVVAFRIGPSSSLVLVGPAAYALFRLLQLGRG